MEVKDAHGSKLAVKGDQVVVHGGNLAIAWRPTRRPSHQPTRTSSVGRKMREMATDAAISDAWREAGSRLSIRVIAPFDLELSDGSSVEVEAFLPDFGGPGGTVVVPLDDEVRGKRAAAGPHFVSLLAEDYRYFDETLFRETLDDWGWFGADSDEPVWYTGKPWS